jgi:hypothetical protein
MRHPHEANHYELSEVVGDHRHDVPWTRINGQNRMQ